MLEQLVNGQDVFPFSAKKEWEILNRLVLERQLLPSLRIATLVSCEARKNHFFK